MNAPAIDRRAFLAGSLQSRFSRSELASRLRREVQDDVGADLLGRTVEHPGVSNVDTVVRGQQRGHARSPEQARGRRWVEREPVHLGAEEREPPDEPRTLEAGVTGDEVMHR